MVAYTRDWLWAAGEGEGWRSSAHTSHRYFEQNTTLYGNPFCCSLTRKCRSAYLIGLFVTVYSITPSCFSNARLFIFLLLLYVIYVVITVTYAHMHAHDQACYFSFSLSFFLSLTHFSLFLFLYFRITAASGEVTSVPEEVKVDLAKGCHRVLRISERFFARAILWAAVAACTPHGACGMYLYFCVSFRIRCASVDYHIFNARAILWPAVADMFVCVINTTLWMHLCVTLFRGLFLFFVLFFLCCFVLDVPFNSAFVFANVVFLFVY